LTGGPGSADSAVLQIRHEPGRVGAPCVGHYVLGHEVPAHQGDFLLRCVYAHSFAAALMVREHER
jgi:hypothetical protein